MASVNAENDFMQKNTLCERIRLIIKHRCRDLKDFAEKTDIPYSTVLRNLKGQRDDLMLRHVSKILRAFPSLSEKWLYSDDGKMHPAEHTPTIRRTGVYSPVEHVQGTNIVYVNVFYVAEAGRHGNEIFRLEASRKIPVLDTYARTALIALEVDGNSMEPTIKNGAVIGVTPLDGDLSVNEMYLVKPPYCGLLVKRTYISEGKLILKSDNPDIPPFEIPHEGYEREAVILGRVVWIWQDV